MSPKHVTEPSIEPLSEQLGSAIVATQESTTSGTYADLATVGPEVSFTVPAGETWDIDVDWAHACWITAGTGSGWAQPVLDLAAPANDDYATQSNGGSATTTQVTSTQTGFRTFEAVPAGAHTIRLRYKRSGDATAQFIRRRLRVTRIAKDQV